MRYSAKIVPMSPYAFDLILRYLQDSPASVLERFDGGAYRRAVLIAGHPVVLQVTSQGTVEQPRLRLEVSGGDLPVAVVDEAIALIRRVFDVDTDITGFLVRAASDPVFGSLARQCRGLRLVRIPDTFEALAWTIIGQQINLAFAGRLKRALIDQFGEVVDFDGEQFALFPTPERLAAIDPASLLQLQFSRQKAAYIHGVAEAIREGRLDFNRVAGLPQPEAIVELQRFHGIGRWTAEYLLLRGFGDPDALPAADVGLRGVIGRWYGLGRAASEQEVRDLGEKWAGWRGVAALYWWFANRQGLLPG